MTRLLRLLIVGGYGAFGGRIVQLLEADARLVIIVAGRSYGKAQAFCRNCAATAAQLVIVRYRGWLGPPRDLPSEPSARHDASASAHNVARMQQAAAYRQPGNLTEKRRSCSFSSPQAHG